MIVTLFFVVASASLALGSCPVPGTLPGADIGKIAGRWYEMAGPTFEGVSLNLSCVTEDFIPREDGAFNFTIGSTRLDGSKQNDYMLAQRTDDQNLLNVYQMSRKTEYAISFFIADTDYDNYLAAYTCFIVPPRATIQTGLIFSRTNTMSAEKYAELTDLLVNKIGVSSSRIGPILHENCDYSPFPQ